MANHEIIIRKTPFLFFKRLIIIAFFFTILPYAAAWILDARSSYEETAAASTLSYNFLIAIILTVLQLLIILIAFVSWYFRSYKINRKEVVYLRANLFEDKKLIDTADITEISIKQGRLARRFDFGDLHLHTRNAGASIKLSDIPAPEQKINQITDRVEPLLRPLPQPPQQTVDQLIAGGENQYVEYKSSLMWDYRRQTANKDLYEPVMKNIVAFMNSAGGAVLVGVGDDGEILGLDADLNTMRKPNTDGWENVFNMAFNKMVGVEYHQYILLEFPLIEDDVICVIHVSAADRPAYLQFKGKEHFYIRAGNASQPLPVSKATEYVQARFAS